MDLWRAFRTPHKISDCETVSALELPHAVSISQRFGFKFKVGVDMQNL